MIQNHFAALFDKKRERDQEPWHIRQLQRETGIATQTISAWYRGTTVALSAKTITLCEFLECDIDDLILYVEDEECSKDC